MEGDGSVNCSIDNQQRVEQCTIVSVVFSLWGGPVQCVFLCRMERDRTGEYKRPKQDGHLYDSGFALQFLSHLLLYARAKVHDINVLACNRKVHISDRYVAHTYDIVVLRACHLAQLDKKISLRHIQFEASHDLYLCGNM